MFEDDLEDRILEEITFNEIQVEFMQSKNYFLWVLTGNETYLDKYYEESLNDPLIIDY